MAARKFVPILISGFVGSGKSTLAKKLAKKYHATFLSGSHIHRAIMEERLHTHLKNAKKIEDGFWETEIGKKGTTMRQHDLSIDQEMDKRMIHAIKKHLHCVSDSRLSPWLYTGKAIRIWLGASEKERVRRVSQRDELPRAKVQATIRARNNADLRIYRTLYGIEMGTDFTPFDLVLNNDTLTPNQTFALVDAFVGHRLHSLSAKKSN